MSEDLRKENDVLRGIVAKVGGACVYCGLEDKSKCVDGFPGCAWADDLMCGEETWASNLLAERNRLLLELDEALRHIYAVEAWADEMSIILGEKGV